MVRGARATLLIAALLGPQVVAFLWAQGREFVLLLPFTSLCSLGAVSLVVMLGRSLGLFVTAVTFALCHGAPVVLPIHIAIGLYLGFLRDRCGSLLPCMLAHFVYNGTLVTLAAT